MVNFLWTIFWFFLDAGLCGVFYTVMNIDPSTRAMSIPLPLFCTSAISSAVTFNYQLSTVTTDGPLCTFLQCYTNCWPLFLKLSSPTHALICPLKFPLLAHLPSLQLYLQLPTLHCDHWWFYATPTVDHSTSSYNKQLLLWYVHFNSHWLHLPSLQLWPSITNSLLWPLWIPMHFLKGYTNCWPCWDLHLPKLHCDHWWNLHCNPTECHLQAHLCLCLLRATHLDTADAPTTTSPHFYLCCWGYVPYPFRYAPTHFCLPSLQLHHDNYISKLYAISPAAVPTRTLSWNYTNQLGCTLMASKPLL